MPYKVIKSSSKCSDSKPWAVVKEDDGRVMGCHNTKTAASKQQAALYANEEKGLPVPDPECDQTPAGSPFTIADLRKIYVANNPIFAQNTTPPPALARMNTPPDEESL